MGAASRAVVAAIAAVGALVAGPGSAAGTGAGSCRAFHAAQVPSSLAYSSLAAVAAIAPNDVWAVGQKGTGPIGTFTVHWDGSGWHRIESPNPGHTYNALFGVVALASDDVWAVGTYSTGGHATLSLVLRWDGSAWSEVPSPNPGTGLNELRALAATPAGDLWAVGFWAKQGSVLTHPYALRWDGSTWVNEQPQDAGMINALSGVSARAPDDVWAVGYSRPTAADPTRVLTEHWDGSRWSRVPAFDPPSSIGNELSGVVQTGPDETWAVGQGKPNGDERTLVERWDGSSWAQVPSQDPGPGFNTLLGVAAQTPNELFAVGGAQDPNRNQITLVERWNGTAWSVVPSDSPGEAPLLNAVVATGGEVWAVGFAHDATFHVRPFAETCRP